MVAYTPDAGVTGADTFDFKVNDGTVDSDNVATVTVHTVIVVTPPKCNKQDATIWGTPGSDYLVGTTGRDVIVGLGGDDIILGLGGNDIICAGGGDDLVSRGRGAD